MEDYVVICFIYFSRNFFALNDMLSHSFDAKTRFSRESKAIFLCRVKRYILVGHLLHLMTLAGLVMSVFFSQLAAKAFSEQVWWAFAVFLYVAFYGSTLPFFAQLDALSRYQNYKLMKDKLFEHGFNARIIAPFAGSRCQRDAVSVAAHDLGMGNVMREHFRKLGYKWYHLLPRLLLRKPSLLFTKSYWQTTLFTRTYVMKHFDY
jgi:hypothetical protein